MFLNIDEYLSHQCLIKMVCPSENIWYQQSILILHATWTLALLPTLRKKKCCNVLHREVCA